MVIIEFHLKKCRNAILAWLCEESGATVRKNIGYFLLSLSWGDENPNDICNRDLKTKKKHFEYSFYQRNTTFATNKLYCRVFVWILTRSTWEVISGQWINISLDTIPGTKWKTRMWFKISSNFEICWYFLIWRRRRCYTCVKKW